MEQERGAAERGRVIFERARIGKLEVKNRLIRAATGDVHAVGGHYTERDFENYERLAAGGVGTIISGFAYAADYPLSPESGMLGIYDDSFISEYRRLTEMTRRYDTKLLLQLVHCGSYTYAGDDVRVIAPSAVANLVSGRLPEAMSREDIGRVQCAFAEAAERAWLAGFDGVELHAGHGFLLSEFLTPYYNRRDDEYGGSDENRARMLFECCRRIRESTGADFPVFVKLNCQDGFDGGITPEGFLAACRGLKQSGASAVEVSGAWYTMKRRRPYFLAETELAAEASGLPAILVGGVRGAEEIEGILNSSKVEYFAMSRPFIAEPELPKRWLAGDRRRSRCLSCNACSKPESELQCVLNKKK
ncbi:MAG: NADH:flavin oxidoreductase [Synergistaceae bacterium]|nr:NADH:flavin oxidoreductase [Synergistaceae bacterium]